MRSIFISNVHFVRPSSIGRRFPFVWRFICRPFHKRNFAIFSESKSMSSGSEESDASEQEEEPLVKSEETSVPIVTRSVKYAIYASHALSTWSERTWAFAVGLIFLAIFDDLFFVSLFALIQSIASIVFSPSVGILIDKTPRLKVVCIFYFLQNTGLALAALASLGLLYTNTDASGGLGTLAAMTVIVFGILSRVGTMGGTIAIEKDWTKCLAGSNHQELAKLNSNLKMIDLICLILAPILSGMLMSFCSLEVAVLQILAYNLIAWFPEVALLKYANRHAPQLQNKSASIKDDMEGKVPLSRKLQNYGKSLLEGFNLYFKQTCVLAMLSLAFLYFTVLSFGFLMTPYLITLGLSEALLSIYRGFAALTGVLGAKAFPIFHSKLGLHTSGLLSITFFLFCILIGSLPDVLNLFFPVAKSLRFNLLVWAICLSRFGLWLFDLSVSQLLQERVDEGQLGRVSSTQKLLENVFAASIYVGGLIASDPRNFVWLMILSVVAVIISFILFCFFFQKTKASKHFPREVELTQNAEI